MREKKEGKEKAATRARREELKGWKSISVNIGEVNDKGVWVECKENVHHLRISEEFHRITSKDLVGTFGAAFDKHVPCLLKLYRARKGAFGQKMEDLLEKLDEKDTDHEERLLRGVSVAILTVIEDDDAAISPNVRDVAVVLEGTITRQKALSTCTPHLVSLFNFSFGAFFEVSQSRCSSSLVLW
ncbi:hypothetical protein JOQ06_017641, partial [Pogonophryne albipinna]